MGDFVGDQPMSQMMSWFLFHGRRWGAGGFHGFE